GHQEPRLSAGRWIVPRDTALHADEKWGGWGPARGAAAAPPFAGGEQADPGSVRNREAKNGVEAAPPVYNGRPQAPFPSPAPMHDVDDDDDDTLGVPTQAAAPGARWPAHAVLTPPAAPLDGPRQDGGPPAGGYLFRPAGGGVFSPAGRAAAESPRGPRVVVRRRRSRRRPADGEQREEDDDDDDDGVDGPVPPGPPPPPPTVPAAAREYTMSGVTVRFPFPAYESQVAMMSKIVRAVQRFENALLESPTGSGKSLALLCACLAWQEAERGRPPAPGPGERESERGNEPAEDGPTPPPRRPGEIVPADSPPAASGRPGEEPQSSACRAAGGGGGPPTFARPGPPEIPAAEGTAVGARSPDAEQQQPAQIRPPRLPGFGAHAPRILFASRTHKQLAQLVGELKRHAAYRPRMAVLGSRKQYCVHPKVSKSADVDEGCTSLCETESGCQYREQTARITSSADVAAGGQLEIWDIEDLVDFGKRTNGCPYYASKELAKQADIVFLPYSYVCNPIIREAMDLSVDGAVIVLDEAHNMKDVAREAGSFEVTDRVLTSVDGELAGLLKDRYYPERIASILVFVGSLLSWVASKEDEYKADDDNRCVIVWSGLQITAETTRLGITSNRLAALRQHLRVLREAKDQLKARRAKNKGRAVSGRTLQVLGNLFVVFQYLLNGHADDFRMVLVKTVWTGPGLPPDAEPEDGNGAPKLPLAFWLNRMPKRTLAFWCLNPGVTFAPLSISARCVILTSGTLSPMDSFASELQTEFPIRLEAPHVIDSGQVWIGVVPHGPSAVQFEGTNRRKGDLRYQDELGAAILELVQRAPGGALCFLPSYSLMDILIGRWRATGLYDRLNHVKLVLQEPPGAAGREAFDFVMKAYYLSVDRAETPPPRLRFRGPRFPLAGQPLHSQNGALLFAVCRGKISEGVDFSDDHARLVMVVGIPYPNSRELVVREKKAYNDHRLLSPFRQGDGHPPASLPALLTGSDWYQIQGFRAINQALGRRDRGHRRRDAEAAAVVCLYCRAPVDAEVVQIVPAAEVRQLHPREVVARLLQSGPGGAPPSPTSMSPPAPPPTATSGPPMVAVVRGIDAEDAAEEGKRHLLFCLLVRRPSVYVPADGVCYEDHCCALCGKTIGARAIGESPSSAGPRLWGLSWIALPQR
ncbi:MAG: hypothetical protein BJ554DRAFT_7346, partial [Olpidium bornovanus]